MARGHCRATSRGLTCWLLPASVLHAAFLVLAAALAPAPIAPAPPAPAPDASLELSLLEDAAGAARPAAALAPPREAASLPTHELPRPERIAAVQPRPDTAHSEAEPLLPGRDEPPAPSAAEESPREPSPALSLDQLGVGSNPFLDVAIPPLTKEEQANARLHAALHPPSLDRERQRGPAGPVADAARGLLLADDALSETNAVINVSVDGSGRVTEVHVLDASSQVKAWQMIAARLAKALEPMKLPANSQQGWAMKLRLASKVQLPSGAAPGLRVGVLGNQVAGSGGPGSSSLELSPSAKFDIKEPIDSVGRHMDSPMRLEVMLLKFKADPTDIGAAARRVVEVAVLSIEPPATR